MTPRTLWTIILKIFGLIILTQALTILLQIFALFVGMANHSNLAIWQTQAYLFIAIGMYLTMVYFFLFRTDWIINKLRLDAAIDEEKIEINIHRSSVLTIVILLSGILLFADGVPMLLKELYSYFAVVNAYVHFIDYPRSGIIVAEFIKTTFAIFMMTSSGLIVNLIERKRRKVALTEETE